MQPLGSEGVPGTSCSLGPERQRGTQQEQGGVCLPCRPGSSPCSLAALSGQTAAEAPKTLPASAPSPGHSAPGLTPTGGAERVGGCGDATPSGQGGWVLDKSQTQSQTCCRTGPALRVKLPPPPTSAVGSSFGNSIPSPPEVPGQPGSDSTASSFFKAESRA